MPFLAVVMSAALLAQGPSPAKSAGDAAFARGDFQTAFREYNDAIARDPADEDAVLGLGTLDLYRNDWKNARTYLTRARTLSPNDPRVQTRLAVLEDRLPQPHRYAFDLQNGRTDIPFAAIDPLPIVRATIAGRTFTFVVDTRAGSIDLTPAAAQSIGIPNGGVVPSIAFPGLTVTNVPAESSKVSYSTGSIAVDGAIGTVFLSHFLSTFDYAHDRLTLRLWESSRSLEGDARQTGAAIEPLWLVGDRLLLASGRVGGGPPMLFALETGSADGAVALADVQQPAMMLAVVSLGRYSRGPVTATALPPGAFEGVPFQIGGTFRNAFFRPATLTLDFAAMKVIVSK